MGNMEQNPIDYQRIFNLSLDLICITGMDGYFKYLNPAWEKNLGYTRDELLSRPFLDFIHPDDHAKNDEEVAKLAAGNQIFHFENRYIHKDGSMRHISWTAQAVADEKEMYCIGRDITKRKQAEDALKEEKTFAESIIETAQTIMLILDVEGRIVRFNPYMEEISGYRLEEVQGKDWFSIFLPEREREQIRQIYLKALTDIQTRGNINSIITKDGDERYIEWYDKTLKDREGKAAGLLAIGQDITDRKQAEEALKKSETKYRSLVENIPQKIFIKDQDSVYLSCNRSYAEDLAIDPEEISGKDDFMFYPRELAEKYRADDKRIMGSGKTETVEENYLIKGEERWVRTTKVPLSRKDGETYAIFGIFEDITERKQAKEALTERTKELELKTKILEEFNTAMNVLLEKREEDKTEVEQNVMANVRELIAPYFDKINKTKLDDRQKAFLNILESNLNEIISPFTRRLSLKYLSLTPKEIQIVNMIKIGYPSKKIANLMNISPRTVDAHRKNIRSKIGLDHKRASLRSHILAHEQ
jgi:PAS domain S-box-containing protein